MRPNWPYKSRRTNCRLFEFAHRKKNVSFSTCIFCKAYHFFLVISQHTRNCKRQKLYKRDVLRYLTTATFGGFQVQFWNSLLDFEVIGVDKERVEPLQLVKYLPGECPPKKMDRFNQEETSGALSLKSCIPYLSLSQPLLYLQLSILWLLSKQNKFTFTSWINLQQVGIEYPRHWYPANWVAGIVFSGTIAPTWTRTRSQSGSLHMQVACLQDEVIWASGLVFVCKACLQFVSSGLLQLQTLQPNIRNVHVDVLQTFDSPTSRVYLDVFIKLQRAWKIGGDREAQKVQVGCIVRGEQRTHTMLVFMSNVAEDDGGGHLHFPRLGRLPSRDFEGRKTNRQKGTNKN